MSHADPLRTLEARLRRSLPRLALEAGVADRVGAALPALHAPEERAGRLEQVLLAASLLLGGVLAGWLAWRVAGGPARLLDLELAVRGSFLAGAVAVAFLLSLGARRLSELDCRLVGRLTGRSLQATRADVVLVRAGAVLLLVLAAIFQLA